MSHYKQGCLGLGQDSTVVRRLSVRSDQISGLNLPEPLPTILLYFALLGGAVFWVKAGGF